MLPGMQRWSLSTALCPKSGKSVEGHLHCWSHTQDWPWLQLLWPRQLRHSSRISGRGRPYFGNWSITSAFFHRHQSIFNHLPMTGWGSQGQLWGRLSSYSGIFEGIHICIFQDILLEPKEWDHAIEMIPGSKASNCKVCPLSLSEQKKLDVFLKENLETGCIWPSKSPMESLVFFIKKKDGSLWLVQDYWALNTIMVKNKYPLPLISELVNKLQEAKCFTKLDVCWGFNNVLMKEGDKWKATFWINHGLYEP